MTETYHDWAARRTGATLAIVMPLATLVLGLTVMDVSFGGLLVAALSWIIGGWILGMMVGLIAAFLWEAVWQPIPDRPGLD